MWHSMPAVDDGEIDEERLEIAAEIANVKDFVMALQMKRL